MNSPDREEGAQPGIVSRRPDFAHMQVDYGDDQREPQAITRTLTLDKLLADVVQQRGRSRRDLRSRTVPRRDVAAAAGAVRRGMLPIRRSEVGGRRSD